MNTLVLSNEGGGGDCVNDDRNTKKVRLKKTGEDLDVNIAIGLTPTSGSSWKEMLLKGGSFESMTIFSGSDILDIEDFEFTERDVVKSNVNGIPTINFSERIRHLLVKDVDTTMVVKLLGRNIGYSTLLNRISNIWKPSQLFHLIDVENRVLEDIGSLVSKVAQLDLKTDSKTREFEALSAMCFSCGRYGHVKGLCPSEMVDSNLPNGVGSGDLKIKDHIDSNGSQDPKDNSSLEKNGAEDENFGLALGKSTRQWVTDSRPSTSCIHGPCSPNSLDWYNREHKPDLVGVLEIRVSGFKADSIIAKLSFQFLHRVEALGFSGDIWVGWRDSASVEI
ncbi:hypothetical protein Godav_004406 [Gossypium davidsonii]|uniref:CCHC-type domain-containing protein n=1 Tax=Gossypium davidsonii TaxID=34287 RepID=A0A7J8SLU8_GOSDV|nr:hypothetical protein [Gossypium davidsonii]